MSWLAREIVERGGAISFRDFMETALYHPSRGYYSASKPRYGRGADFLTAPTASRWYGAVVGGWCQRLSTALGPLAVVDLASGDGSFLNRFSERLGDGMPDTVAELISVERSPAMRALQEQAARACPRPWRVVERVDDVELPAAVLVHASELYDALPVHRVVRRGDHVLEMWVAAKGAELEWCERPAPPILESYLEGHGVQLTDGQVAEINASAEPMHCELLSRMGEGSVVVVLDYGYEARRLYNPRGRLGGSLSCYKRHELSRDPLQTPGELDITAHVNWDDLRRAATAAGFTEVGLFPLAEFLVRAGLAAEVERESLGMEAELDANTVSERQEIKRLLDPEGMGSDLKVLVQAGPAVADPVTKSLALD